MIDKDWARSFNHLKPINMKGLDSKKDQLLTATNVAEILNVTKRTVMTYKANGTLSYYQVGRVLRFRSEDIQKHIEDNMVQPQNFAL
jgi:excisionase family DNA binding protein